MTHHRRLATRFLALFLTLAAAGAAFGQEFARHVPEGNIAFISVRNMRSDAGVSWLREAWHGSPRESTLRTFFDSVAYEAISIAVMDESDATGVPILLAATLATGTQATSAAADRMITSETTGAVKSRSSGGREIRYVETIDPANEFGAYTIIDGAIILGYDATVVETALSRGGAVGAAEFAAFSKLIGSASDGLFFANNRNGSFAGFLAPLEKKWGMSLLLSADALSWMGSAFDVVDSQTIVGKIIFRTEDSDALYDVEDDASFLGEAFRRKFVAEAIEYESEVTTDGTTVTLDFEIRGLEPLWIRLFEQGVLSIIQP